MPTITDTDAAILAFEHQWFRYAGAREARIRELFGMSAIRYAQTLNRILDDPAAEAHDPLTVRRLRRLRESRQRSRLSA